jgi:hypothetical protein
MANRLSLAHLGMSGLLVAVDDLTLAVDPPAPAAAPTVITWTERERVAGASTGAPVAASAPILAWLRREGTALTPGVPTPFAGWTITSFPYTPIPYATPTEALRKTLSAVRRPDRALGRLAHLARRPRGLPVALLVEGAGLRIGLLQQALHRFVTDQACGELANAMGPLHLLVAGTDFDDESATGQHMGRFDARHRVLADHIGPVRRALGLPTRPLAVSLADAPAGTQLLEVGGRLDRLD